MELAERCENCMIDTFDQVHFSFEDCLVNASMNLKRDLKLL